MLIDTDILIDFLRNKQEARRFLAEQEQPLSISVITVAELFAGVRGEKEMEDLESLTDSCHVIPLSKKIAKRGGSILKTYRGSHGTGFGDGLIAATALELNTTLVTRNARHFPMIENLLIPYQ